MAQRETTPDDRLHVLVCAQDGSVCSTLAQMNALNDDFEVESAAIRALAVGETVEIGGGAAGHYQVTRLEDLSSGAPYGRPCAFALGTLWRRCVEASKAEQAAIDRGDDPAPYRKARKRAVAAHAKASGTGQA